jgi:hypothetical protein
MAALEQVFTETMPPDMGYDYLGMALAGSHIKLAERTRIPFAAYSGDHDRPFRPNVTKHSAGPAL